MSDETDKGLLVLLQRPNEPVFIPKENNSISFDLPDDYYTDEFKNKHIKTGIVAGDTLQASSASTRKILKTKMIKASGPELGAFGAASDIRSLDVITSDFSGVDLPSSHVSIPIKNIKQPDYAFAMAISRDDFFSLFDVKHRAIAGQLVSLWLKIDDKDELLATAAYAKDRLNAFLFQYAISVVLQHRNDTKNLNIPSVVQQFPDKFIAAAVVPRIIRQASTIEDIDRKPVPIPLNFTATNAEDEQRLAFFREDIGVNSHHWHWHLVYPGDTDMKVVNKDRRGELFYYMHSQILARYNVERISSGLAKVKKLSNLRDPIPEAYFPKMSNTAQNKAFPPRMANAHLKDNLRGNNTVEITDLELWRDRIYNAIDRGFVVNEKMESIKLDDITGIDILGNIIEPTILSKNLKFYGHLHNMGHNIIAYAHDPDGRYMEEAGVMGDVTTAMRDPIFYRWHAFIESIFQRYKETLPEYTINQLKYEDIIVNSINVQVDKLTDKFINNLVTYYEESTVDLAAGLDFAPNGRMLATFTHLQHADFVYTISVKNNSTAERKGTCRIFLAPVVDERGTTLKYNDQRLLMIEMDKFIITMTPGENEITRRSNESSVTIPFRRSIRPHDTKNLPRTNEEIAKTQFCGCGWPNHLLVPKGSMSGVTFELFVMVSNYDDDAVEQKIEINDKCNDSVSYCGLRDKLYPDKRAMGFPFDRLSNENVDTLEKFVNQSKNMKLQKIEIHFSKDKRINA